jgi:hypothetical protein
MNFFMSFIKTIFLKKTSTSVLIADKLPVLHMFCEQMRLKTFFILKIEATHWSLSKTFIFGIWNFTFKKNVLFQIFYSLEGIIMRIQSCQRSDWINWIWSFSKTWFFLSFNCSASFRIFSLFTTRRTGCNFWIFGTYGRRPLRIFFLLLFCRNDIQ